MMLDEIKQATAKDVILQYLVYQIQNNSWNSRYTLPEKFKDADCAKQGRFQRVKGNLTISVLANIIFRGNRIVIPKREQFRSLMRDT